MYRASEASEAEAWTLVWASLSGIASSNDLPLGPYDPLIVKGKRRPKDSLGLGSQSHRRDPTILDRALNQGALPRRLPPPDFAVPDAPNSPSTTTNASATSKASKSLETHGDTYEAGTQMPRASQRMAPLLEDPDAQFRSIDL
ncbi:hypothetical protein E4U22_004164 [Claviceps purpurea]|nr:hypothetical protein E4U22_004164 [Claviceps purpurea]